MITSFFLLSTLVYWCLFNVGYDDVTSMSLLSLLSEVNFSFGNWDTLVGLPPCTPTGWAMQTEFLCKSRFILCFLWLLETCGRQSYESLTTFAWLISFNLPGMGVPTKNIRFSQHSSLDLWSTKAALTHQGLVKGG